MPDYNQEQAMKTKRLSREQVRALELLRDGYRIMAGGFGVGRVFRKEEGREYPRTAPLPRRPTMDVLEREGLVEFKTPGRHRHEGVHESEWFITHAGREALDG